MSRRPYLVLPLLLLVLSGCVTTPGRVSVGVHASDVAIEVETPPPEPYYEPAPPPRDGYVWAPGYWQWRQPRYVWVPGTWLVVRPEYDWTPGVWITIGSRWQFRPGHWRHAPRGSYHAHPAPRYEPRPMPRPEPRWGNVERPDRRDGRDQGWRDNDGRGNPRNDRGGDRRDDDDRGGRDGRGGTNDRGDRGDDRRPPQRDEQRPAPPRTQPGNGVDRNPGFQRPQPPSQAQPQRPERPDRSERIERYKPPVRQERSEPFRRTEKPRTGRE